MAKADAPLSLRPKLRGGLGSAALLLASIGLAVGTGECGARLLPEQMSGTSPRMLHTWHPTAGIGLAPGFSMPDQDPEDKNTHWAATHINAHGFRSTRPLQDDDDHLRVLMLGDSFTFGFGVRDEQTFSHYLQSALRTAVPDAEVLNSGVSGTSNVQQLAYFDSEGAKYGPDIVVLQIYAGNDPAGNWADRQGLRVASRYGHSQPFLASSDPIYRHGDGTQAVYVQPGSTGQRLDEWLFYNSALYRRSVEGLLNLPAARKVGAAAELFTLRPMSAKSLPVRTATTSQAEIELTCQLAQRFVTSTRALRAEPVVLVIPAQYNHYEDRDHALLKCLQAQGAPLVDPDFFLRAHEFYFMRALAPQGHFLPEENQVIAAALFRHITEKVLHLDNAEAGLSEALPFHSPLTTSRSLQLRGTANDEAYAGLQNAPRLPPEAIATASSSTEETSMAPGRATELAFRYEAGATYKFAQGWGFGKVQFDIELKDRMALKAVVVKSRTDYLDWRTSFVSVVDGDSGEFLGLSAAAPGEQRATFVIAVERPTKNLVVTVYRPNGTQGILLRGLELVGPMTDRAP